VSQTPSQNTIAEAVINIRAQGSAQVAQEMKAAEGAVNSAASTTTEGVGRIEGAVRGMRNALGGAVTAFTSLVGRVAAVTAVFGILYDIGTRVRDMFMGVSREANEAERKIAGMSSSMERLRAIQEKIKEDTTAAGAGFLNRALQGDFRRLSEIEADIARNQTLLSYDARKQAIEKEKAELEAQRKIDDAAMSSSRDRAEAYYQEQLDALEKINRQEAVTVEKITEARKAASNALVQAQLDAELQAARQVFEFRRKKLEEEDAAALAEWTKQMQKRAEDYRRAMQGIVSDFERQMDAATARMAGGLGASMDRMVVILEDIYRSMPRGGF
jgi:hypothetical protein